MDETWVRHLKITHNDLCVTPAIKNYNTLWENTIDLDIKRMRNNQNNLKEVLSTYCYFHPCDGYVQGMNFIANVFIYKLSAGGAFWALTRFMGYFRTRMVCFDKDAFHDYCSTWNKYFTEFTDGLSPDGEFVMALKWGLFAMTCGKDTIDDVSVLWDAMLTYPQSKWLQFSAAVASAACVRHLQKTGDVYQSRLIIPQVRFYNPEQLVRRAKRLMCQLMINRPSGLDMEL